MIDEQREEQASLYVLGALPADEATAFEQALRTDPELRDLVRGLRATAETLALAVPRVNPPARLKQEIMGRVAALDKVVPVPATESSWAIWLPWALAACLAVSAGVMWGQGQRLQKQAEELRVQVEAVQKRAEAVRGQAEISQKQIATLDVELRALRDKDALAEMKIAFLASLLKDSPKAVAVSLWDKDKQKGVLIVHDLPAPPADKDYQLWVVDTQAAAPVNAGVFSVDAKGGVHFEFKPAQKIQVADKFVVSVEPKGGVAVHKDGPIVLLGN